MKKASKSGLFEVWTEVVIEGDCCTRSRAYWDPIGEYHSLAEANAAADQAAEELCYSGFELRYPEAFARVHNTAAARRAERHQAELALRYASEYDPEECPF